ncbi:hypothetical protein I4F81_010370 [Pyropia yezoensis]|uniref:Uncharacterized protein n=1 Tax=Pyropia yezoensis TaxID=2788 RepID=A0ACC3CDI9_PYRYE|nr:hypothetical protein I4F81_010370 [Neopyropia yezoensis]
MEGGEGGAPPSGGVPSSPLLPVLALCCVERERALLRFFPRSPCSPLSSGDPGDAGNVSPRRGGCVRVRGHWHTPNSPVPFRCCIRVLCFFLCPLPSRAACGCVRRTTTLSLGRPRHRTGSSSGISRTRRSGPRRSVRHRPLPLAPSLPLPLLAAFPPDCAVAGLSLFAVRPPLAWLWRPFAALLLALYRPFFASSTPRPSPLPFSLHQQLMALCCVYDDDQRELACVRLRAARPPCAAAGAASNVYRVVV